MLFKASLPSRQKILGRGAEPFQKEHGPAHSGVKRLRGIAWGPVLPRGQAKSTNGGKLIRKPVLNFFHTSAIGGGYLGADEETKRFCPGHQANDRGGDKEKENE